MPAQARLNPQAVATRVLAQVVEHGRYLDAALDEAFAALPTHLRTQGALIQEMCFGTAREWPRLAAIARAYLERPLKDETVRALLLLGFYQLRAMRAPAHAAVAETVEAAAHLRKPWAKGLVNACLRAYLRAPERAQATLDSDIEARHAHPRWLIEAVQRAWPGQWEAVLTANNERAPLALRVNTRRTNRADYLARLAADGIGAREAACTASGVVLDSPLPVERVPGFAEGLVSVQDAAAQLAANLLDPPAGARVLDACAAPGGKAAHLLERAGTIELTAVEIDAVRARRVRDNLARLGLGARQIVADATEPGGWWDGQPFDSILLDVPCSASGVIRRHPDIKLRRRPQDLAALTATQQRLLEALWPLLAPGGKLLYATCSILPDENEQQLVRFLAAHPDAAPEPLALDLGLTRAVGRQILPGTLCGQSAPMDGFYYGALRKR